MSLSSRANYVAALTVALTQATDVQEVLLTDIRITATTIAVLVPKLSNAKLLAATKVKHQRRSLMQHNVRHTSSVLLHIYNGLSNTRFLIDTGAAAVSVLPARVGQRCLNLILVLYTVNNTRIPVYCRRTLKLDLNLR